MLDQPAAMHVARIKSSHTDKQGRAREYESRLLRHTYRDGGKVRHKTLANLSKMPDHVVDAVEAALKGEVLVPAGRAAVTVARSLPHGHVAAVYAVARTLGLPALLGPAGRHRDLALALIISRVAHPGSKLSTLAWWDDVTLGADLGVADATTDEAYAAATCPCGSDAATVTAACPAGTSASLLRAASTASTTGAGIFDRFATVLCLTLPPSR